VSHRFLQSKVCAAEAAPRRAVALADSDDAWRHTLVTEGSHGNFTRGIQKLPFQADGPEIVIINKKPGGLGLGFVCMR
jgi:hypothetical protein